MTHIYQSFWDIVNHSQLQICMSIKKRWFISREILHSSLTWNLNPDHLKCCFMFNVDVGPQAEVTWKVYYTTYETCIIRMDRIHCTLIQFYNQKTSCGKEPTYFCSIWNLHNHSNVDTCSMVTNLYDTVTWKVSSQKYDTGISHMD